MSYVQGFLLPVPNANKEAYRKMASVAAEVFMENGATNVVEAWADDVPDGEHTSFPMAVKKQEDESVVFSWITWPDKEKATKGMEAAMVDDRLQNGFPDMPFDGKRMMWGGFEPIVEK